jgi:hypothetical protein
MLDGDMKVASNIWFPADFNRRNLSLEQSTTGNASEGCTSPGLDANQTCLSSFYLLG